MHSLTASAAQPLQKELPAASHQSMQRLHTLVEASRSRLQGRGGAGPGAAGRGSEYLGGFAAGLRDQVLGLVALIKDDEAVEGGAGPVGELAKAGVPPVTGAGQAGVGQENDPLINANLRHSYLRKRITVL